MPGGGGGVQYLPLPPVVYMYSGVSKYSLFWANKCNFSLKVLASIILSKPQQLMNNA